MSDNLIPDLADMPEEVLEAVAKAVYDDEPFGTPGGWEREGEEFRDLYRADARAAYPVIAAWVTAQALRKAADMMFSDEAALTDNEPRWLRARADEAEGVLDA